MSRKYSQNSVVLIVTIGISAVLTGVTASGLPGFEVVGEAPGGQILTNPDVPPPGNVLWLWCDGHPRACRDGLHRLWTGRRSCSRHRGAAVG